MRRNGSNRIIGGFVHISYELIDHAAFRELSEGAIRVYLMSMRKSNRKDTDRHNVIFQFSYPEARKRLSLSPGTFRRAMRQLHSMGFLDYHAPGGLRCDGKAPKTYRLSHRWKEWGTPN